MSRPYTARTVILAMLPLCMKFKLTLNIINTRIKYQMGGPILDTSLLNLLAQWTYKLNKRNNNIEH